MKPITVLIVDDSVLIRKLYCELLASEPDIQVLDTAVDAVDAREKIKRLNPDVLTLDIEMPGMDGLSFLEKIMSLRPMPVIMASTLTQKGAGETIRALEIGAVDYISKPTANIEDAMEQLKHDLTSKIRAAAKANVKPKGAAKPAEVKVLSFNPPSPMRHIIAIGSSTGGVEALRDIFTVLPANSPPIVITQHMPEQFTPSFAARLNSISQVEVSEAVHGAKLKSGHAYIAKGGVHMSIAKLGGQLVCQLADGPLVSGHKPSVDVLFDSVADVVGASAVGVMLTGMGKDGAAGMLRMRERGAYNIGQNQTSCVVYGMPRAAKEAGAVHTELPLSEIAGHMLDFCAKDRKIASA